MTDPVLSSARSPGTPQTTWMALRLPTDPSAPWKPAERDKAIAMPGSRQCADWRNIKCQPKICLFFVVVLTDSTTNLCSNWKYSALIHVIICLQVYCVFFFFRLILFYFILIPQQTSAATESTQFLLMSSFACVLCLSVARKRCLHLKIYMFHTVWLK